MFVIVAGAADTFLAGAPQIRGLVRVRVELEETGRYVVDHPATGIFGTGETAVSALSDLVQAFKDHLDTLEGEASLSKGLAEQRRFLRKLLIRPR